MPAVEPRAAPFDGYLPRQEAVADLVAPPYDSVPVEASHRPVAGNPLSFLNVVRSEVDHPEQTTDERRAMLEATRDRLRVILASGAYHYHAGPMYLVCRLEQHGHSQTGVVADVSLDAYAAGEVRVHESTVQGQEDRLVEYMGEVKASFLPVFLIHRTAPDIDAAVDAVVTSPPTVDVTTAEGLRMTLWAVEDSAGVAAVGEALAAAGRLYVADGHHRLAAAARYARVRGSGSGPHRRVVSVLFPADQLAIHNYNRCITDLGGLDEAQFLAAVGERFRVGSLDGAAPPEGQGEMTMVVGGRWYRLAVPQEAQQRPGAAGLDVSILQDDLLSPVLGIDDPRADPRLDFVAGTLGLGELDRLTTDGYAVGIAVHPTSVEDLLAVSDRGELMPPKSTWFAPKLRSGLVVRLL